MSVKLIISHRAEKHLIKLNKNIAIGIRRHLDKMVENPWSVDLQKVEGKKNTWRLRVGEYRAEVEFNKKNKTATVKQVKIKERMDY